MILVSFSCAVSDICCSGNASVIIGISICYPDICFSKLSYYYVMMCKICGLYALSLTKKKYMSYRLQLKFQM